MSKVFYTKPSITELEIEYVNDAIRNGWGDLCYHYIERFQQAFSDHFNGLYAIPTSSCTGALHLLIKALGIGPGDEVIVPESTWLASVSPIIYEGGVPVFADIDPYSWCIDPDNIKAKITKKTKAILVVDLYGNAAEMDEITKIANEYDLLIIEDVAESLGTTYKGKKLGTFGEGSVFSFHGTKMMTTGEGGMVLTGQPELYDKMIQINDHGRISGEKRPFFPHSIGLKYKISNLQAALGLAQIERIDELIRRKREIYYAYKKEISGLDKIRMNPDVGHIKSSYWLPTIIIEGISEALRDELIAYLKAKEIHTRPFFYPLSMLRMFQDNRSNRHAYSIYSKGLNLPSYHDMDISDIKKVVAEIKEFLHNNGIN